MFIHMITAVFQARVWVGIKEDGIVEKWTWDDELTPLDGRTAAAHEWAEQHLDDLTVDDLRTLISIHKEDPPEELFEVWFVGQLTGYSTYGLDGGEYEEDLKILDCKIQSLPHKFLYEEKKDKELNG